MVGTTIKIALRSRIDSSPLQICRGDRLLIINDVRRPLGRELQQRYSLDDAHVYDLYSFIDTYKKDLVKGYLNAVDRFFLGFRQLIRSRYYAGNILLYHFSSKRTDVFPTFKRFCVISLRDQIAAQFPDSRISFHPNLPASSKPFSVGTKLRLGLSSVRFFLKVLFSRVILGPRRRIDDLQDAEAVFYTQYSRQSKGAFDNVNYGSVFNALAQNHKCVYLISMLTDGVHDGAGWAGLYTRSRVIASAPKPVYLMERLIDVSLIRRLFRLLMQYVFCVFALSNRKLLQLRPDDLYVFQDEIHPSVRRMFGYAYVLELSRTLAAVIKDKVFVYYLVEQNYGKLLSFYLHDRNVTLGCQHGTSCHLRLGHYLTPEERKITTFPTYVIAEGENEKRSLEWVHPDVQVQVLGAPRVDSLATLAGTRRGEAHAPRERKEVLVPLSLRGGLEILEYVADTLKQRTDVHFYIKPHPTSGTQGAQATEFLDKAGVANPQSGYCLYTDNVYQLLSRVDYVLFTDTSVGLEFAECGIRPLVAEPVADLSLSPVTDIRLFRPEISLRSLWISKSEDLIGLLSDDAPSDPGRVVPKDFFFAHFGNATNKWAEFIAEQITRVRNRAAVRSGAADSDL